MMRRELGEIIYGADFDADEMRDHPELFRARMEGVRAANQRWLRWLVNQGYTEMEASVIIGQASEI